MHVIAAKAVALKEAMGDDFKEYQKQVVINSKKLSDEMVRHGFRIVSGGTDNHLMLVDVKVKGFTGKEAAEILDKVKITVNKNMIPFDKESAFVTSGIRLGTPAVTTRGMKEAEMVEEAKEMEPDELDEEPVAMALAPTGQMGRALLRLTIGVLLLVALVNVPINRHGVSLARVMPDSAALIIRDGLLLKAENADE